MKKKERPRSERSEPPAREVKTYIEEKLRKKSAFSIFKSEFLGKEGKWSCCLFNFLVGFWAEKVRELIPLLYLN